MFKVIRNILNYVWYVLSGNYTFAQYLSKNGFNRVQVNATAINGVDISNLGNSIPNFLNCVNAVPDLEWIVQRNNETKPLWEQLDILNTKNEIYCYCSPRTRRSC